MILVVTVVLKGSVLVGKIGRGSGGGENLINFFRVFWIIVQIFWTLSWGRSPIGSKSFAIFFSFYVANFYVCVYEWLSDWVFLSICVFYVWFGRRCKQPTTISREWPSSNDGNWSVGDCCCWTMSKKVVSSVRLWQTITSTKKKVLLLLLFLLNISTRNLCSISQNKKFYCFFFLDVFAVQKIVFVCCYYYRCIVICYVISCLFLERICCFLWFNRFFLLKLFCIS